MRRFPALVLIVTLSGCGSNSVPTPNTDPDVVKKLEQDVDKMQRTGGGGEGKKRNGG